MNLDYDFLLEFFFFFAGGFPLEEMNFSFFLLLLLFLVFIYLAVPGLSCSMCDF